MLARFPSGRSVPRMRDSSASETYSNSVTTLETPDTCEATMAARWPSSRVTTPIRYTTLRSVTTLMALAVRLRSRTKPALTRAVREESRVLAAKSSTGLISISL